MFKNLLNIATIRGKIVLSFLFYIAIIFFLIVVFYVHNKRIEEVKRSTIRLEQIYTATLQLVKYERDFLGFETKSNNFYKTSTSPTLVKHRRLYDSLVLDLKVLNKSSDKKIKLASKTLLSILNNYNTSFSVLSKKIFERGFDTFGLEGQLKELGQSLEDKGVSINSTAIFSFRIHEKDMLLQNDPKIDNRIDRLTSQLIIEIDKSDVANVRKKELKDILDDYRNTFYKLSEVRKAIGFTSDDGLNGTLKQNSQQLFFQMESIIRYGRERESSNLSSLKFTFIVVIAVCLISCITFSYIISRKLTKPIADLSLIISQVQNENFSSQVQLIDSESDDEAGELTRNFNNMVQLVRNNLKEIKEKNVRLEIQNLKLTNINEKLAASEKSLKESNAIKDKFFSIIAHDLKGPLATITSFLQIMINYSEGFTEEERTKLAKDMHKSVENLSALLENLLQWARSQMGHIDFTPKKISIHRSLQKTIDLLNAKASGKLIIIESRIPSNTFVFADENMLDFVFRNLLSNALKFTNPGGAIIVSAKSLDSLVQVSVKDNGIGINEEDLVKLFRTDYHLTKPGTFKEEGTGLGLILCKEFVEKNGGKIWVESKSNEGTEFKFTLQRVDQVLKEVEV